MSVGMDASTGKLLTGWAHVRQSIQKVLTTELGSRTQRRDFGSLLSRLIDYPQNTETIVDFYMATAEALRPRLVNGSWYGEPRFRLAQVNLEASVPGSVTLMMTGDYYPRGHLGEFEKASPETLIFSASQLAELLISDQSGPL